MRAYVSRTLFLGVSLDMVFVKLFFLLFFNLSYKINFHQNCNGIVTYKCLICFENVFSAHIKMYCYKYIKTIYLTSKLHIRILEQYQYIYVYLYYYDVYLLKLKYVSPFSDISNYFQFTLQHMIITTITTDD